MSFFAGVSTKRIDEGDDSVYDAKSLESDEDDSDKRSFVNFNL